MRYYKDICKDIKNISLFNTTKKPISSDNISSNPDTKTKIILDSYLNFVYDYFIQNDSFKGKAITSDEESNTINFGHSDTINSSAFEENNIKSEEIAKHSIMNYILKTLCINMIATETFLQEDIDFNKKCSEFGNITIEDLKIPSEIYDESIFEKIISHINRMDDVRTPEEMLKEFELAVQLINSLFIFMMDKKETGNDNLTPVIIYVIIKAKPKRMYFNIKFINYFFDEKDKKGKNEYYIIQAITSLDYIMKELKVNSKPKNKMNKKKSEKEKDIEAAPTPQ
jgi:hypothetical protein